MDIISTLDCSSWANVKKVITCAYCKDLFKQPCTLICCHTFCCSCIESIQSCPTCQPNKFFSFKLLNFENHFLTRLTKVFINRRKCNQSSCTNCKQSTTICKRCFIIGCSKCNSRSPCIDNSKQHVSHRVDLNDTPDQLLHFFSATGCCEQYKTVEHTNYCYECKQMKCSECLKSCTNHKIRKLKNHYKSLQDLEVKRSITEQERIFVQRKEKLDTLFKEDFDKVEQWFKHAYNCLYHEKQSTIFSLKVFQISINKRIERFKSDLSFISQTANDFKKYFESLLEKSSDHERYMYKENTLEITYREEALKIGIGKINNQFENNLDCEKVFQKFCTRTHTCEGITRCNVKCKKVDNLRSHLNTEQKYKYEVISYCQALNDHDKLETDQLVVKGNCYSMFSLPHPSSELVKCAKQPLTDISKCASCVSQLKLYNKSIAQQDLEIQLKDTGNTLYENVVLSSITKLHDISNNMIHNIERGIMHLHKGDVLIYFTEIQKNFVELEGFAVDYQKLLNRFSDEMQSFQRKHIDQPANIIYSSILIHIIMDCQTYITSVHQTVINICHTKTMIELLRNEDGEYIDDETTNCITDEGFQTEIVSYYSTCVALNEICKSSVELINNWKQIKA